MMTRPMTHATPITSLTTELSTGSTILLRFFFFQAEDGIRDLTVTGVQTCALPISVSPFSLKYTVPSGAMAPPSGYHHRSSSPFTWVGGRNVPGSPYPWEATT